MLHPTFLYHGSPDLINDTYMASETYFTDDIEVAKQYGRYVYCFKTDMHTIEIFQLDSLKEHFISTRLIPLYLFHIRDFQ